MKINLTTALSLLVLILSIGGIVCSLYIMAHDGHWSYLILLALSLLFMDLSCNKLAKEEEKQAHS